MNWRTSWQFCSLQHSLEVGNCIYTQFREKKFSGVKYLVQYCSGCLVMEPCRHHLSVYGHGFILIFCLIFNYVGVFPVTSGQFTNEPCIFQVTLHTWWCLGCLGSHCFTWSKKAPELSHYSWILKDKLKATKNRLDSALFYIPVSVHFVTKTIILCIIKITKWWHSHCNFHKSRNRRENNEENSGHLGWIPLRFSSSELCWIFCREDFSPI